MEGKPGQNLQMENFGENFVNEQQCRAYQYYADFDISIYRDVAPDAYFAQNLDFYAEKITCRG